MRNTSLLFDENVSGRVAEDLSSILDTNIYQVSELFSGATDEKILQYAVKNNLTVVTLDTDFAHLVFRDKHNHEGVILLRVSDERPQSISAILQRFFSKTPCISNDSFVTITDKKVRIRTSK